jgi:hypothetical protein
MLGRRRRRGPPGGGPAVVTGDPPSRQPEESPVSITLHAQRPTDRGRAPQRRDAARDLARALRRALGEGRLRAARAVRLLSGAGRRARGHDLRDAGGQGRGQGHRHPRGRDRGRASADGRRLRGRGRPAVRLLHPRHHGPGQAPARSDAGSVARRDRQGHRRPPVPVHRLHQDHRRGPAPGPGSARRAGAQARARRRRRRARGPLPRPGAGPGRAALRRRPAPRRHVVRRAAPVGAPAGQGRARRQPPAPPRTRA